MMENSSELLRWMVSGPEITRTVKEFETIEDNSYYEQRRMNSSILLHDETKGVKKELKKECPKTSCDNHRDGKSLFGNKYRPPCLRFMGHCGC